MEYVLTISLERYQTAKKKKKKKKKKELRKLSFESLPPPPQKSIVELRDLTERFLS